MHKLYPKLSVETAPKTLVLANGAFPECPIALELIDRWAKGDRAYRLISCDGAVNKLYAHTGLLPDLVVGDLDSIASELRQQLSERLRHFSDRDTNDLTKTITFVSRRLGLRDISLLGASGGREDHLLGNISLLSGYAPLVDELVMLTDEGHFRLLTQSSSLEAEVGQQVSLFDFVGGAITTQGLHWPLVSYRLPHIWSGTLNRADAPIISVEIESPVLVFLAKTVIR